MSQLILIYKTQSTTQKSTALQHFGIILPPISRYPVWSFHVKFKFTERLSYNTKHSIKEVFI